MVTQCLNKKFDTLINSWNFKFYYELAILILDEKKLTKYNKNIDLNTQKNFIKNLFQKLNIKGIINDKLIISDNKLFYHKSSSDILYNIYISCLIYLLIYDFNDDIPFFDIFEGFENYEIFRKKSPFFYYHSLILNKNINKRKLNICNENIDYYINYEKEITNNILNNNLKFENKLNNLVEILTNKYDKLRENLIKINNNLSKELNKLDKKYWKPDYKYEFQINKKYLIEFKLFINKIYDKIVDNEIIINNKIDFKNILYGYKNEIKNVNDNIQKNIDFMKKYNYYLSNISLKDLKNDENLIGKFEIKINKQKKNIEYWKNIFNKLNDIN